MAVKRVGGFLWRFVWFRQVCVVCSARGICSKWIRRNTPLLLGLRKAMLAAGHFDLAREAAAMMADVEAGRDV